MHVGGQQVSSKSQHYQQNGPNTHLPCEKLPYLEPKEEVVWFAYNHIVAVHDQEDAFGCYLHIGENPEKKKSAQATD